MGRIVGPVASVAHPALIVPMAHLHFDPKRPPPGIAKPAIFYDCVSGAHRNSDRSAGCCAPSCRNSRKSSFPDCREALP